MAGSSDAGAHITSKISCFVCGLSFHGMTLLTAGVSGNASSQATVIEAPSLPSMSVNGTQARAVKLFGPSKVSIPAAFPNAAAGLAAAAFIFLGRKPET